MRDNIQVGHEGHDGPQRAPSLKLESNWKYLINSDSEKFRERKEHNQLPSAIGCNRYREIFLKFFSYT